MNIDACIGLWIVLYDRPAGEMVDLMDSFTAFGWRRKESFGKRFRGHSTQHSIDRKEYERA